MESMMDAFGFSVDLGAFCGDCYAVLIIFSTASSDIFFHCLFECLRMTSQSVSRPSLVSFSVILFSH